MAVSSGCGSEDKATPACTAGDTRECLGPGACMGAQECRADGAGFQSCVCAGNGGSGNGVSGSGNAGSSPGSAGTAGAVALPPGGAGGAQGGDGGATGGSLAGAAGMGNAALECEPVGAEGCEPNQNCKITNDGTECVLAGDGIEHSRCGDSGQCAAGLACHRGNCVKVCRETADCALEEGIACRSILALPSVGKIGGCLQGCNPLGQDCPAGQACYLGACLTPTQVEGSQGTACSDAYDCAEGFDCLLDDDANGKPDCGKYCDASAQQKPCGNGYTCYALSTAFPTVPASWGLCGLSK